MDLIPKTEELETSKIKQILYNHLDMLFEKLELLNKKEEELNKKTDKIEFPEPLNNLLKLQKYQLEKLDNINQKIEQLKSKNQSK